MAFKFWRFLSISRSPLGSTVRETIRKLVQVPNLMESTDANVRVIVDTTLEKTVFHSVFLTVLSTKYWCSP